MQRAFFPRRSEKFLGQAKEVVEWFVTNTELNPKTTAAMLSLYKEYLQSDNNNAVIPPTKKTFADIVKKSLQAIATGDRIDFVYKQRSLIQGIYYVSQNKFLFEERGDQKERYNYS